MRIADCCRKDVVVADRGANIAEVARTMRECHVGDLVVVDRADGADRRVGIVTDRELVVEVLAQDVSPGDVIVDDVMTADPAVAGEDDDVLDTLARMRDLGVRRMPVVDSGGLLRGIIAVDDLLEVLASSVNSLVGLVLTEVRTEALRRS
jgi:CBS domain-containing protein